MEAVRDARQWECELCGATGFTTLYHVAVHRELHMDAARADAEGAVEETKEELVDDVLRALLPITTEDADELDAAADLEEDLPPPPPPAPAPTPAGPQPEPEPAVESKEEPAEDPVLSRLADELFFEVLSFVSGEMAGACGLVSRAWQQSAWSERVFELQCRRTFPGQSPHARALRVERWRSWRRMFALRPRARTTGFYVLRRSYVKTPVRDMFTEAPATGVLEVVYYRYLRFFDDGTVRYALSVVPPQRAMAMLDRDAHAHKDVCQGRFFVERGCIRVAVATSYSHMNLDLEFEGKSRGRGAYNERLRLVAHSSIAFSNRQGLPVSHRVADVDVFNFWRAWSF